MSIREIARRAGLGVGTLYRHFPAREDLVDAVLEDAFEELVAIAAAALDQEDAWAGFTEFIEQALALHARNRGLKDVVETRVHGRERAETMRRRLGPLVVRLVERAQADGLLRSDFAPQDIPLLFWGADRVNELTADVAPQLWRRQLAFVLDGLRATAATKSPQPPLTEQQLRRVGRNVRKAKHS
ncbi:MAG: TetR/AcrR family transcriptional regulator [Gaiellaceae bacterium]